MTARKSNLFFALLAGMLILTVLMCIHANYRQQHDAGIRIEKRALMKRLPLTDLCLFTEASYTRHLSQADRHAAFQDAPSSLEHFPSGSIYTPPCLLRKP